MSWQEWVAGLLIILCVARIIYGTFLFFRRVRKGDNPCESCVSGCELKRMLDEKKHDCGKKQKPSKKNCCG